jgi:hypothetical protein
LALPVHGRRRRRHAGGLGGADRDRQARRARRRRPKAVRRRRRDLLDFTGVQREQQPFLRLQHGARAESGRQGRE